MEYKRVDLLSTRKGESCMNGRCAADRNERGQKRTGLGVEKERETGEQNGRGDQEQRERKRQGHEEEEEQENGEKQGDREEQPEEVS